jgi:hypothetical protein
VEALVERPPAARAANAVADGDYRHRQGNRPGDSGDASQDLKRIAGHDGSSR